MKAVVIGDMVITDEYITMGGESTIRYAMRRLLESPRSTIIVVDIENRPLGLLDARHILKAVDAGMDVDNCPVRDIMPEDIITAREGDLLIETVNKFADAGNNGLVVVDSNGRVVGYFSINDYRYAVRIIDSLSEDDLQNLKSLQMAAHYKEILKDL